MTSSEERTNIVMQLSKMRDSTMRSKDLLSAIRIACLRGKESLDKQKKACDIQNIMRSKRDALQQFSLRF